MCIPLLNLLINATSLGYLYQNYLKATWCKLDRKYIPPQRLGVKGWSPGQYLGGGDVTVLGGLKDHFDDIIER